LFGKNQKKELEEEFQVAKRVDGIKANGNFLGQALLCWLVQMSLCGLLVYEMVSPDSHGDYILANYPDSAAIVLARFSCGIILHMQLQGELVAGMRNMKFALNHDYRFDRVFVAWSAGFMQAVSIFVIEIVNFIVILQASTYLEIVMNFLALAIIANFDNAFYNALGFEKMKFILTNPAFKDLYTIKRTTSRNAFKNEENLLDDPTVPPFLKGEGKPLMYMKIDFWDRTYFHMLLRVIYKILRVLQISVWFYFVPFLALLGSYIVPYYSQMKGAKICTNDNLL